MVVSEELMMIERIGIGATAFILTYLLLRKTQERAFAQADRVMQMAETTIKDNTIALNKMVEGLTRHMNQKDCFMEELRETQRIANDTAKDIAKIAAKAAAKDAIVWAKENMRGGKYD